MNGVLGTGQLDNAAAGPSAGLYNGIGRNINIKIVADKGSTPPGYGFSPILVRKALIDSGKVKTLHDVKGMTWAEPAEASVSFCTSNAAWQKGGLTHKDFNEVFMGFPDHIVAYQNGSIDAGNTTEPAATRAVELGAAVRFWTNDQFYPNQQIATVLYSTQFADKKEIATRWMIGYLKAVRLYNDALKDGHYAGPAAAEVIAILSKRTAVKSPDIYKALTPNGCDPNGKLNMVSLKARLANVQRRRLRQGERGRRTGPRHLERRGRTQDPRTLQEENGLAHRDFGVRHPRDDVVEFARPVFGLVEGLRPHVNRSDDAVARVEAQIFLDLGIVDHLAGFPAGEDASALRGDQQVLHGGRRRGKIFLSDLFVRVGPRADDDQRRRAQRFLRLTCDERVASAGVNARSRALGPKLSQPLACRSRDNGKAPRFGHTVVRGQGGELDQLAQGPRGDLA